MRTPLHIRTTVLPGNRIEIAAPDLREGEPIDVFLVSPGVPASSQSSILEFLDSLPPGPRLFETWEEIEKHFQEERNAWDL
jgi:hypothetical protein